MSHANLTRHAPLHPLLAYWIHISALMLMPLSARVFAGGEAG